jgi:hypothetical protein
MGVGNRTVLRAGPATEMGGHGECASESQERAAR